MPHTAVLLDLDGTLVDTNPTHVESYLRAFAAFGHSVDQPSIERQVGKGGDKLVPAIIGGDADHQDGEAIRARAEAIFTRLLAPARRFRLFPGAVELIEELRSQGVKTAIATSSGDDLLDAIFRSAPVDLRDRVDAVTTESDVDASKPDADVVRAALEALGARPEDALLIGDTIYDFEASSRADVMGVGVKTWIWDEDALRAAGAAEVFGELDQLLTAWREEGVEAWMRGRMEAWRAG